MLMGGEKILGHLKKKLKIQGGQTTADGRVSLEEAECLCMCEAAPMMEVNGKYFGDLTEKKIDEIIDGLK
jgi:NADH-quinone oxidoreductase subunit E